MAFGSGRHPHWEWTGTDTQWCMDHAGPSQVLPTWQSGSRPNPPATSLSRSCPQASMASTERKTTQTPPLTLFPEISTLHTRIRPPATEVRKKKKTGRDRAPPRVAGGTLADGTLESAAKLVFSPCAIRLLGSPWVCPAQLRVSKVLHHPAGVGEIERTSI